MDVWSTAKAGVKFVSEVADQVSPILQVISALYKRYEEVQANRKRCGRLVEKVKVIERILNDVADEHLDNAQVRRTLATLRYVLSSAEELVRKHADTHWLLRTMKANGLKEEFAELNDRLGEVSEHLSLSLQVEQVRQLKKLCEATQRQADDQADTEADQQDWERVLPQLEKMDGKLDNIQTDISNLEISINYIKHHMPKQHGERSTDQSDMVNATQEFFRSSIAQYKADVRDQFGKVKEYNSQPGSWVMVSECYTDLVIVQRHRERQMKEEEIRGRGRDLHSAFARSSKDYLCTSVAQFFSPNSKGVVPRAVILQGHSGYGKTFTAHKIMDDWASGRLYKDLFDLVFYLKSKQLNNVTEKCSLVDLLLHGDIEKSTVLHVLRESPQRVLFVLDGFDELRLSRSPESLASLRRLEPETAASVETVLLALLSGRMLRKSSLLVTTRSTASKVLSDMLKGPQHFTEILGFSIAAVQNYFKAFFASEKNGEVGRRALSHVMGTETLLTACFIPVTCWIVCNVFRDVLRDDTHLPSMLDTSTSIFAHFVSTQMEYHGPSPRLDDDQWSHLLRRLGELAMDGVMKQTVLFDECEVVQKVPDQHVGPFLGKFFLKKVSKLEAKYSFMHLSFQEFFAALFLLSCDPDVAKENVTQILQRVQEDLYTSDQKLHMSHLLPVIQFLFGLVNQNVTRLHWLSSPQNISPLLEEWICDLIRAEEGLPRTHNIQLFILHCLYEVHEGGFVSRAMEVWNSINLNGIALKKTDCSVLAFCVRHCRAMDRLMLTHCNLTGDKLKVLTEALAKSRDLGLVVERLRDGDVCHLITALGEGKMVADLQVEKSSLSLETLLQVFTCLATQKQVNTAHFNLRVPYATTPMEEGEDVCVSWTDQPEEVETAGLRVSVERKITSALYSTEQLKCEHILKLGLDDPALCISGISLSQSAHPELFRNDWTHLLETVHTLADRPVAEQVDVVQSCLLRVPDVKTVELVLTCLTADMVTKFLSFCQACALDSGRCKLSEGAGGREESVCSDVSLRKTGTSVRLTVKPHPADSLSEVTFAMATLSEESDWTSVFRNIGGLPGCVHPSLVDAVSGLQSLLLTVSCLTESWAAALLTLLQEPRTASLKFCSLRVQDPPTDTGDSICSFLSVEQEGSDIMLVVEYHRQVTPLTEVQITDVALSLPQSQLPFNDLHTIRSLRDLTQGEFVEAVRRVPGLEKIKLVIGSLTGAWAAPLCTLVEDCPTLTSITVDAGQGGERLLLEEAVQALQEGLQSLRECHSRPQLTITLTGRRCNKRADPCTTPGDGERGCNRRVQLQSTQLGPFTHTLLHQEEEQEQDRGAGEDREENGSQETGAAEQEEEKEEEEEEDKRADEDTSLMPPNPTPADTGAAEEEEGGEREGEEMDSRAGEKREESVTQETVAVGEDGPDEGTSLLPRRPVTPLLDTDTRPEQEDTGCCCCCCRCQLQ